jgi:23S rRNA (uracil1939-C5)-methyltransferase
MDLRIEKLVAGGEGLGYVDGKAVFVRGVLPGERVSVQLRQSRRDYERAELRGIAEPSPHRVPPPCPLAGTCGGCDWMHIAYEEQLAQKLAVVREALRRTGGLDDEPALAEGVLRIVPSAPLGSRTRAQLHRDAAGRLGFMGVRSDRVIPAPACPAAAPGVEAVLSDPARAPSDLDRFTVAVHDRGAAVEGRDDDADLTVSVCGQPMIFSVGCFFQSNLSLLDGMVSWALDGLGAPGDRAADLYAGVGVLGAHLAARGATVTCVESSAMAAAYARRNVRGEGHEFYPMSVEAWIMSGAARADFTTVVVDPPRPGLSPDVTAWLAAKPPQRLAYVSCSPVTLARDLGILLGRGFTLESLRLFDFYPQTSHVEAVARLRGPA